MIPVHDADEDLGSGNKRYRKIHCSELVTGTLRTGAGAGDASGTASNNPVSALAAGRKIAFGQHTTVAAADTVVTGLATVVSVVASYETDPADANCYVSAQKGDQAGSPAAGSIIIKTWQNTGGTDPTPAAAGAFSKLVNWIAIGT